MFYIVFVVSMLILFGYLAFVEGRSDKKMRDAKERVKIKLDKKLFDKEDK